MVLDDKEEVILLTFFVCHVEHSAHIEDDDVTQHVPNPKPNHYKGTKCSA